MEKKREKRDPQEFSCRGIMEGNEEEKEECKNKMIFNPCYNSFKYSSKTPVLNLYVYYYQPHLHISSCGQHHIRGIKL